ncbi:lysis system i-spanin subunit Rz [Undibacterium sp.]|uniref:lysis system i-spanin subunit Rz n=1 Tax=Undibacterium sp. TaxID=1914977 RepID=UPI0037525D3E
MISLRLKVIGGLSLFTLFLLAAQWVGSLPDHYRDEGRQEVLAKYREASRIALLERNAEIERIKKDHANTNKIIIDDYKARLSILNDKYLAARAVGLRVPKIACERPPTDTETASTSGNHEAESIRLPSRIESGLFDLARKADEVNIQLGACQAWIKLNGF